MQITIPKQMKLSEQVERVADAIRAELESKDTRVRLMSVVQNTSDIKFEYELFDAPYSDFQ